MRNRIPKQYLSVLMLGILLCACIIWPGTSVAFADLSKVADSSQMTTVEDVVEAGMTPVFAVSLKDGDYPVEVKSSSSMFRIEAAILHVADGQMEAELRMSGKSYLYVYPGSALEASDAPESSLISYTEDDEGGYRFTIPVEALDAPLPCASYSKNKELWYDRTLLFRVDSLPEEAFADGFFTTARTLGLKDGDYYVPVSLSGGSGKAQITSPARMSVKGGSCTAEIVWSSRNYDYMKFRGEMYPLLDSENGSRFEIPLAYFDRPMAVIADTVAMSEPHEITYRLLFDSSGIEAVS